MVGPYPCQPDRLEVKKPRCDLSAAPALRITRHGGRRPPTQRQSPLDGPLDAVSGCRSSPLTASPVAGQQTYRTALAVFLRRRSRWVSVSRARGRSVQTAVRGEHVPSRGCTRSIRGDSMLCSVLFYGDP